METTEIQERNNQIALMLGAIYSEIAEAWGFGDARIEDKEITIHGKLHKNLVWAKRWEKELKFHSDWNWLMGAIKKILSIVSENDDMEIYNIIIDQIPDIEAVFIAVSNFAQLYNENKL
jgi:hypothetical protein